MRLTFSAAFLLTAVAAQAAAGSFMATRAIDSAVAGFLGASAGEPGGARSAVDPRLKLAACPAPLAVSWYGQSGKTLQVSCPGPAWRVFVQVGAASAGAVADAGETVIQRGETVSLVAEGAGFVLTRQAEALEAGSLGSWIKVRPVGDKTQPVRAQVAGPGEVRLAIL